MRNSVILRKLKYDGHAKRELSCDLVEVRDDWLVVYFSPDDHWHRHEGELITPRNWRYLWYVNTRLPLAASTAFDQLGEVVERYVDAALPGTMEGRVISFVDLDLDLMAPTGEPAFIKDIEDFGRRQRELAYPPEVVAAAWEGIRIGCELLSAGEYPFDGSASELLGRVLASKGPL